MVMGNLLHYAIVFLVVALIAAAVGFGGVAGFAMEAAQLLFWVFLVLFVYPWSPLSPGALDVSATFIKGDPQ
jgi:uncharacterized membrane protein YtjA (UPF0391 family)